VADTTAGLEARIERVTVRHLSMPIDPPIRSGIHNIAGVETVITEVDAGGERGIGYAFAFSRAEATAVKVLAIELGELVAAAPARGPRDHWRAMWQHINFIGQEGPAVMALAAIDTALWDLLARAAGLPLHALLGAEARPSPAYAAGGWISWTVDEVIEEARAFQEAGYRAYKMRVGQPDWREDVRRVYAVREALGDDMGLMVDVNQAWSVATALRAGRELESAELLWIEEPVEAQDIRGTVQVSRELRTPVAAGETLWARRGFQSLLEAGGSDVVQLDLMRCGGIAEFGAIATLAEARRLPIASHMFTGISAHLMAAAPNAYLIEHLPGWFDALFDELPDIRDGLVHPSSSPGLGLNLSNEAVSRWQVE
jgi:L-alanine-DL-glutamate epimerase-like enolase superfamily enzyme